MKKFILSKHMIKKPSFWVVVVVILIAAAGGCLFWSGGFGEPGYDDAVSEQEASPSPSEEESSEREPKPESSEESESEPAPDTSPALWNNGNRTIYEYVPENANYRQLYEISQGQRVTMQEMLLRCGEIAGVEPVFNDLYFMVTERSPEGDETWPVVDLNGNFIDKELADANTEARFLNTVAVNMRDRYLVTAKITFLRDGGPYHSEYLSFGADEAYPMPAISVGTLSAEEYTALRAEIPYSGLAESYAVRMSRNDYLVEPPGDRGREFVELLARVGDPGRDIASPQSFSNQYLLICGIRSSTMYDAAVTTTLQPIGESVLDASFTLKEHVEGAVANLFGDGLTLVHEDVNAFLWHAKEGVYTPPHIGGPAYPQPVIYDCEELDDRYVLTVGYVDVTALGYMDDEDMYKKDYARVMKDVETTERREVVLLKQPDGSVTFYSHLYLNPAD